MDRENGFPKFGQCRTKGGGGSWKSMFLPDFFCGWPLCEDEQRSVMTLQAVQLGFS